MKINLNDSCYVIKRIIEKEKKKKKSKFRTMDESMMENFSFSFLPILSFNFELLNMNCLFKEI